VVEARNLEVADMLTGTSDPYTVLNYGGQVVKTTIKKTNLNPIWKESFEFERTGGSNVLELSVYDYDAYTRDDVIGEVDIQLEDYPPNGQIYDKWFHLNDGKEQLNSKIRLFIQHITHGTHDFEKETDTINQQFIAKEKELEGVKDMIELTEKPFAMFQIEKREQQMETKIGKTLAPQHGERQISEKLLKLTSRAPWIPIMLGGIVVYIVFTLLACLFRPAFWDLCN